MSEWARIVGEISESQRARGDRAYDRLVKAVRNGDEISLSDHDLVLAISRALWARQLATAQLGLSELEIRTAADAARMAERRAAA